MIEKIIEICIGTDRSKHIRARLSLLLVDGGNVIHEHYHSISIEPGADLAALRAGNEAHIAKPGGGVPGAPWPAIPDDEWAKVEKCCVVVHTPDVLFKATAEVEAQIADIQAKRAILAEARALAKSESEALQADLGELARLRGAARSPVPVA
jgi:hypothetical protein